MPKLALIPFVKTYGKRSLHIWYTIKILVTIGTPCTHLHNLNQTSIHLEYLYLILEKEAIHSIFFYGSG